MLWALGVPRMCECVGHVHEETGATILPTPNPGILAPVASSLFGQDWFTFPILELWGRILLGGLLVTHMETQTLLAGQCVDRCDNQMDLG